MPEFIDYYHVLKVPREATDSDIRRAYREVAKDCHPDRNSSPAAHETFLAVGRAYEVLGDPQRRTQYNFQYDRHYGHGPKPNSSGASSLDRARAKRADRYQRGRAYSSRVRYRGASYQPTAEDMRRRKKREGADTASAVQAEIFKRYAAKALAQQEGHLESFRVFARVMQFLCAGILGVCLFMIVDKGLPLRKAAETVTGQQELPWSIDKPGLNRVFTSRRSFNVPRSYAEELTIGRRVSIQTSLISDMPLKVFYQAYGREYSIRVNSSLYGNFFPLIWCLAAMCLAVLIFRDNPEFNAYLGVVTVMLVVVFAGDLLFGG